MALIPLSKSDPAQLHPDAFDVRGWEVRTEVDDEKAGSVDDVLMDGAGTPHLLDVGTGMLSRHILVPLSQAWADASRKVIWIHGLCRDDLKHMPSYDQHPDLLTAEFENKLVDDFAAISDGTARRKAAARPADDRLVRLGKGKEFHVSKGSSDPRGWKVMGGDGARLGKVIELIVDRDDLRVRYLDVDVAEKKLGLEGIDRHVLIPVDRTRLDHKHKSVVVDGLFARDLATYPVFTGLPLAKGVDEDLLSRYRGQDRRSEGWVDAAARRFFGGGRQRLTTEVAPAEPRQPPTPQSPPERAAAAEAETVVRPQEGEEVRIRVSGGDIIIEKHPGGSDHG
jgi:hypothetical protein